MRATVSGNNHNVHQVYKKRIGKGFTIHRRLGLNKSTISDDRKRELKAWSLDHKWDLRITHSKYPFIIVDTDTKMVNPKLAHKINKLGMKMNRYVWMGEGLRTRARQQQLWNEYVNRGYAPPTVARPGTSNHETGNAADISLYLNGTHNAYTNVGYSKQARHIMKNLGLGLPVPGEAWHTEITNVWRA